MAAEDHELFPILMDLKGGQGRIEGKMDVYKGEVDGLKVEWDNDKKWRRLHTYIFVPIMTIFTTIFARGHRG